MTARKIAVQGLIEKLREIFHDFPPSDNKWIEYYSQSKGYAFNEIKDFTGLIKLFKPYIRGLVIYDPLLNATKYLAITISALDNLLPVSPKMFKEKRMGLKSLPVKVDFRRRWMDSIDAYRWGLKELMPRCSHRNVFSAGKSYDEVEMGKDEAVVLGIDYSVREKAFVYNLSPDTIRYPKQAACIDWILGKLAPLSEVWGWAEPEPQFCMQVSKNGHYIVCGAAPNLSFHANVKTNSTKFKQRFHIKPQDIDLERKYYVSYITNEGDTPKVFSSFMYGGWLEPDRGKVPINWGFDPLYIDKFPAMSEYYYKTATENDYFFAGPSGAGYVYPSLLPHPEVYMKHVKKYLQRGDIKFVDIWDTADIGDTIDGLNLASPLIQKDVQLTGVEGITSRSLGDIHIEVINEKIPIVTHDWTLMYHNCSPEELIRRINAVAQKYPPPFFITVFSPTSASYFRKVTDGLNTNKFKVVRLDEFFSAIKLARELEISPRKITVTAGTEIPFRGSLRNYYGKGRLKSGNIIVELPEDWQISDTENLKYKSIPVGKRVNFNFSIAVPPKVECSHYVINIRNTSNTHKVTIPVKIEQVGYKTDFKEINEWMCRGASIKKSGRRLAVVQSETRGIGKISHKVKVNLDKYPILQIKIGSVMHYKDNWAVKVKDQNGREITINDFDEVKGIFRGVFSWDVKKATGWSGKKIFILSVFVRTYHHFFGIEWIKFTSKEPH